MEHPACVLAIATASPPFSVQQSKFSEYYYDVVGTTVGEGLRRKFKYICMLVFLYSQSHFGFQVIGQKLQRDFYTAEEMLLSNPELLAPKLDNRMQLASVGVPMLASAAAEKAIKSWGRDKTDITHLVFATVTGVEMPGADFQLIKILGLKPNVKRVMLYQQACAAGVTVMKVAKDIAENNKGARVLAVCSVIISSALFDEVLLSKAETNPEDLVVSSLFGDGAGAMVIGSHPVQGERPFYAMHHASQVLLEDSIHIAEVIPREHGLTVRLHKDLPYILNDNIERVLTSNLKAMSHLGTPISFDKFFWTLHPGGPKIIDMIQSKLSLDEENFQASWEVLNDFGNMSSASLFFVLHRLLQISLAKGCDTTGVGKKWGFLVGFGPGVTVETMLLESFPTM